MRIRTYVAAFVAAGTAFAVVGAIPPNAVAAAGPQPLTPQLIAQLAQGPQKPVIVLLKNQHPETPPNKANDQRRSAVTQTDQAPLVDQVRQTGATHVHQYSVINGFAAQMTAAESAHLATDPDVAAIVPDLPVKMGTDTPAAAPTSASPKATPQVPNPSVCPADPSKPLLEPEALQVTNDAFGDASTPQAQNLATGKGVKVAYLADGVDPNNPDFIRADGSHVFVDNQDFTGEGLDAPNDDREAFGDASSIAAQGRQTYDLSKFVSASNPLPPGCNIRILGMAPGASLVGLKVIASTGFGSTSGVVQAIDYAVDTDHVDVINESLGSNPYPDSNTDPFSLANDAAVAAGVTIVNSTGDAGFGNSIDSPASDPNIISAGASSTYQIMAQTWDSLPGFNGRFVSDNVSAISSSGVTQSGRVYDVIAPGDLGWALCSANTAIHLGCVAFNGTPSPIQAFGGTSQASPLTAGTAALIIQAYAQTHNGVKPTPALIKQIITSTATDNLDPSQRQGDGLLNALAAVQAAMSISDENGSPKAQGNGLLFGSSQLDATGNPNSGKSFDLKVTNVGASPQTVTAHGRNLSQTLTDQRGSIVLNTTLPANMTSRGGAPDVFVTTKFTVPAGADHLDGSIAWANPNGNTETLVLLDPTGTFVGYSLPQASIGPDFGHVDVHSPVAGTWTALIYGLHSTAGFNAPVNFEFKTTRYTNFGTVTGTLHLAPGASGTLHVSANTPNKPGDLPAAVEVDTASHQRHAVPLVLRSLVPNDGHGTFAGVLQGGNGRGGGPAQTNTFRFDIPSGKKNVAVSVSLQGATNNNVTGYLVSPDGQIVSQSTNVLALNANGQPTEFGQSLQGYLRNPAAGRWEFVVIFGNPVAGAATQEPFTGKLRFDVVDVKASGVPTSAKTVLAAGKPATVTVRVHNTGAATSGFYVDARTAALSDIQLVPGSSASSVPLTPSASVGYIVPTDTTQVTGITSGSVPVSADLAPNTGEPENLALPGPGNISVVTDRSPVISQGLWLLEADPIGPFAAPNSGVVNFAAVAHTQGFDTAVTSSTGDHWLTGVQAQPPAFNPVTIDAGGNGTITVTITPNAARGTVVSGFLYVDDTTLSNQAGDELIAIPYTYTVG
ncbi:MAG TPA: S8 family serine peptidase [Pseudonocardiaceae bacterium]|nr:S8 family serine peptidase [Pseudonocardiaceae bacterium]